MGTVKTRKDGFERFFLSKQTDTDKAKEFIHKNIEKIIDFKARGMTLKEVVSFLKQKGIQINYNSFLRYYDIELKKFQALASVKSEV